MAKHFLVAITISSMRLSSASSLTEGFCRVGHDACLAPDRLEQMSNWKFKLEATCRLQLELALGSWILKAVVLCITTLHPVNHAAGPFTSSMVSQHLLAAVASRQEELV